MIILKNKENFTLGQKIRHIRLLNGLSGKAFGELLGVTKATISQWENNTNTPSTDNLIKIAEYGKVSTDYLINDTEVPCYIKDTYELLRATEDISNIKALVKSYWDKCQYEDKTLWTNFALEELLTPEDYYTILHALARHIVSNKRRAPKK